MPRPLDGDADGTPASDMGVYEFVHPMADTDADGLTDTSELYGADPTEGDSDGDGLGAGGEVVADTDPLDEGSLLAFTGLAPTNPMSDQVWTTPSWRRNPFNPKQPLQGSHMIAVFCIAAGVDMILSLPFRGLGKWPEAIIPLWIGSRSLNGALFIRSCSNTANWSP